MIVTDHQLCQSSYAFGLIELTFFNLKFHNFWAVYVITYRKSLHMHQIAIMLNSPKTLDRVNLLPSHHRVRAEMTEAVVNGAIT